MLFTNIITVKLESGEREIFLSPFRFQSKDRPTLKSGKIEIIYFYDHVNDNNYKAMLEQDDVDEKFRSDQYIINYGQDFEKNYLGSLHVDFDEKRCWQWEGKLNEQDAKILAECLFDPDLRSRKVTLFTPTRASDINLTRK